MPGFSDQNLFLAATFKDRGRGRGRLWAKRPIASREPSKSESEKKRQPKLEPRKCSLDRIRAAGQVQHPASPRIRRENKQQRKARTGTWSRRVPACSDLAYSSK